MKLKFCSDCGKETYLWKSSPPLCKYCAGKLKKPIVSKPIATKNKPIKKVSTKHAQTLKKYKVLRLKFLDENPECQVKLIGCGFDSTEIEHRQGKRTKELWLDTSKWFAICRYCHHQIENVLGEEVYKLGIKLRRNV